MIRHRHHGPKFPYHTTRGRIRFRKRPIHNNKNKPRKIQKRMAWNIEDAEREAHKIEWMTPKEYLERTGLDPEEAINDPQYQYFFDMDKQKSRPIEELGRYIEDPNTKVTIPYVEDYKGINTAHEGRHRAIAAELLKHDKIPVSVPLDQSERDEIAEEFIQKAFPNSNSSYKNEWRDRFRRGLTNPEAYMDSEHISIYKDILRKRKLVM